MRRVLNMYEQETITIATRGRGTYRIDDDITRIVAGSGVITGLCHVFCRHTSASLILCENADPTVRRDLETFMARRDDPLHHLRSRRYLVGLRPRDSARGAGALRLAARTLPANLRGTLGRRYARASRGAAQVALGPAARHDRTASSLDRATGGRGWLRT